MIVMSKLYNLLEERTSYLLAFRHVKDTTSTIALWYHLFVFRRMTYRLAPSITFPDSLSKQPPRSKQENNGEHEQARNEQKCPANQVIYHVNNLNESDQHHESC